MNPKENLLRAIRREGPEWVPDGLDGPDCMADCVTIFSPVVERPKDIDAPDAFGVGWSYNPRAEGGTFPTHGGHSIGHISRWRQELTVPDVNAQDWTSIRTRVDGVDRSQKLVMGLIEMGLFERAYLLLGMEEALMAFITEPAEMYELLGVIADYKIELIRKFDDVVGLDMLWLGDDWGTQQALFLPPHVWRQIIKPHLKRIYDCAKELRILINQHSCGKIDAIFGDLVELGADMWNPCQPCNDLVCLKREYGHRISFHGGMDSQFVLDRPGVTAAEVRAEARKLIDILAPGGGYIAGPSQRVPRDPALVAALRDEVKRYGREVYGRPAPALE
jgi:hypothetical protein